jgi:hypothetical protein
MADPTRQVDVLLLLLVVATTVGFPMTIVLHPEAATRGIKMMNYKLVAGVERRSPVASSRKRRFLGWS